MLRGKGIYESLLTAHEKSIGAENLEEVKSGKSSFLIDDSTFGSDTTDGALRIFTKDFVIQANMTIELGDTTKDTGSWEKDFYASDVTKHYYPEANSVSEKEISDWFAKHVLDFL